MKPTTPTPEEILTATADVFRVPVKKLQTPKDQRREWVLPRQVGAYMIDKHYGYGVTRAARDMHVDHSTAAQRTRRVEIRLAQKDDDLLEHIELIQERIREGTPIAARPGSAQKILVAIRELQQARVQVDAALEAMQDVADVFEIVMPGARDEALQEAARRNRIEQAKAERAARRNGG